MQKLWFQTYVVQPLKFFCGDCGQTFEPNKDLNENELLKYDILLLAVPFSFLGVFLVMGFTFAGISLSEGLVHFGVLWSVYVPSIAVLFWALLKFFGKFAYVRERKHKRTVVTLFLLTFSMLAILMLVGYILLIQALL